MSSSVFINYANAQNRKLNKVSGVLIYYQSDIGDQQNTGIPQDVIFLPVKDKSLLQNAGFDSLIKQSLIENNNEVLLVYFQGMRWRNPDLGKDLLQCRRTAGVLTDKNWRGRTDTASIVLGTIVFDTTFERQRIDGPPFRDNVDLLFNEYKYHFGILDLPHDMGFPISFEIIK